MRRIPTLLMLSLLAVPARADLEVPGQYPTIQAAIDAAPPNASIHVAAGTWPGALDTHGKSLAISGVSPELTIVDGLGADAVLHAGPGGTVNVFELTLTGGVNGAVTDSAAVLNLDSCTVRGNSGVGATGLVHAYLCEFRDNGDAGLSGFVSAQLCDFSGNGGWGALDLQGATAPQVLDCRFLGNGLGGLRLAVGGGSGTGGADILVVRCLFTGDNLQLSASEFSGPGLSRVVRCTVLDAKVKVMQGALEVDSSIVLAAQPFLDLSTTGDLSVGWSDVLGGWPGPGNIDADPLWADAEHGDYTLLPGSPCINSGNPAMHDADGSVVEMGTVTYQPWTDLGGGLAGSGVAKHLQPGGALEAGLGVSFALVPAVAGPPAWLVLGTSALGAPFKGGTLWPQPDLVLGPFLVFGDSFPPWVSGFWPSGVPAGFSFWAQAWWLDAGAPAGLASTNGVKGVAP